MEYWPPSRPKRQISWGDDLLNAVPSTAGTFPSRFSMVRMVKAASSVSKNRNANLASVLAASLGGKQNGKGQGRQGQLKKPVSKFSEKLRATDPSLKEVCDSSEWIQSGASSAPIFVFRGEFDIMRNGTAVLAYKTVDDVEAAVATLNGSELKGASLEVEKQAPKEGKQPPAGKPSPQKMLVKKLPVPKQRAAAGKVWVSRLGKGKVAKGTGKGKTAADDKIKMKEKLAAFSAAQKVWIGGLSEGTTWKEVETHLSVVAKPKLTHVFKATGCAYLRKSCKAGRYRNPEAYTGAYEAEEDVLTVITALDGSELNGNTFWFFATLLQKAAMMWSMFLVAGVLPEVHEQMSVQSERPLQVDHWTMPERKAERFSFVSVLRPNQVDRYLRHQKQGKVKTKEEIATRQQVGFDFGLIDEAWRLIVGAEASAANTQLEASRSFDASGSYSFCFNGRFSGPRISATADAVGFTNVRYPSPLPPQAEALWPKLSINLPPSFPLRSGVFKGFCSESLPFGLQGFFRVLV
ncbi:hypothetical protein AK812_SmicGene17439 [Symbiodinium microadriaticum]|uniref:RRM domain-containing protein n=1 Tax=Symbiodinium microadriaticum TaxID=2951 RepID=A0A1Q9DXQ5_SYMMI|nr:hypothetical protein AK812_SmicGene17439 [Symbiodinium microadriaticum]